MKTKRDNAIHFRLNDIERNAVLTVAIQENISISETARLMIREACQHRGLGSLASASLAPSKKEDSAHD